jgi:alpha-L-fucosidase
MGGRDIVKEYVTACRKYGLKVGLYYSEPDWYFNREFQNFLYYEIARYYKNVP